MAYRAAWRKANPVNCLDLVAKWHETAPIAIKFLCRARMLQTYQRSAIWIFWREEQNEAWATRIAFKSCYDPVLLTGWAKCRCRVNRHKAAARVELQLTFDRSSRIIFTFEGRPDRRMERDATGWVRPFNCSQSIFCLRWWLVRCIYSTDDLYVWVVGRGWVRYKRFEALRVVRQRVEIIVVIGVVCSIRIRSRDQAVLGVRAVLLRPPMVKVMRQVARVLPFELWWANMHLCGRIKLRSNSACTYE